MRVPLAFAALFAACACSPQAPQPTGGNAQVSSAAEAPKVQPKAAPASAPAAAAPAMARAGERRCGWLVNPTPGNWWLDDRDGQWVLATQGREPAPGMDDMPDMSIAGWVETNGHYGHGCACMTIAADADGQVTRVADAQPKPLKQCQADRKLPKPE